MEIEKIKKIEDILDKLGLEKEPERVVYDQSSLRIYSKNYVIEAVKPLGSCLTSLLLQVPPSH